MCALDSRYAPKAGWQIYNMRPKPFFPIQNMPRLVLVQQMNSAFTEAKMPSTSSSCRSLNEMLSDALQEAKFCHRDHDTEKQGLLHN